MVAANGENKCMLFTTAKTENVLYLRKKRKYSCIWADCARCCYITVDSETTALQNPYQCILKQTHYKKTLFTQWLDEKSGILLKLHHSVLSGKMQTF
jgi:hypothetical protein